MSMKDLEGSTFLEMKNIYNELQDKQNVLKEQLNILTDKNIQELINKEISNIEKQLNEINNTKLYSQKYMNSEIRSIELWRD